MRRHQQGKWSTEGFLGWNWTLMILGGPFQVRIFHNPVQENWRGGRRSEPERGSEDLDGGDKPQSR